MRNLTLIIKCTPGRRMSWTSAAPAGYGTPVAGLGHRTTVMVERKRFVSELPAARIQNQSTDLPLVASAPPERRP